jgi:Flp pilus assembly protein TadG
MAVEQHSARLPKLTAGSPKSNAKKTWRLRKEFLPPNRLYCMMASRGLPAAVEVTPKENPQMRTKRNNTPRLRKQKQRGSEMLEFTLVILPVLGFLFLLLDVAWSVYSRSTLQYAVAQGVRYAVTCQTMTGLGQKDSIRTVVQRSAFGRLGANSSAAAWSSIQVHFFRPDGTDVSTTVGGNGQYNGQLPLVEVSVEAFSLSTFMPTIKMPGLGTLSPIVMSARAWDRMEASPSTGPPAM